MINKIIILVVAVVLATEVHSREIVSIIGVGDIMLGTNYPSKRYLPPNQGRDLMKDVEDILNNADVTFGNLEGTILDTKGSARKNCKKCYSFRMPEYLADNLVTAGFDVLSIANNHIMDFDKKGVDNTLRVLNEKWIYAAGVESQKSVTFTKGGVNYGFAAFAPNIGTVQLTDITGAEEIVRELDKTSDIVIVSFHGGAEGTANQHVKNKTEYFYGENRGNVYQFAHRVIDAGADIVFGHGPHVTRAVEVYNNRFIAYSLGNFCTYGRFNLEGATGIAPIIKVNVTREGGFVDAEITPIKQRYWKGVFSDHKKRAITKVRELTEADGFLDNITIDSDGFINKL